MCQPTQPSDADAGGDDASDDDKRDATIERWLAYWATLDHGAQQEVLDRMLAIGRDVKTRR
jgi:hypothetical protein